VVGLGDCGFVWLQNHLRQVVGREGGKKGGGEEKEREEERMERMR